MNFTGKPEAKKLKDLDSEFIKTEAITILREDYRYKEVIGIHWRISDADIKDTYFIYRFLKAVRKEMDKGRIISLYWILKESKIESMAMGRDFEALIDLKFQYVYI